VEVMQHAQGAAGRGPRVTRQPRGASGRETRIQPTAGSTSRVRRTRFQVQALPAPASNPRTMTFPPTKTWSPRAHDAPAGRSAVRERGCARAGTHAPTPQPRWAPLPGASQRHRGPGRFLGGVGVSRASTSL